ncbi:HTH domain-containing protein [Haloplanus vescus]|uniref:Taxis protein CheF n=1 Tax=Haloplanus vescus TaxID=555874 RepID=A0A1H3W9X0_9EURY|nr:CheF family chemotaxis protein [Haloplanus vescus]SDZ83770.1 HTH domain-containing protein [Haloplanus vescus]
MSERVIADFVGEFFLTDMDRDDPVQGRIVMSPKRLVLAADDHKVTIPTDDIFDIAVGHVPPEMRAFFSDSVTIAYREGNQRRMAVIEAESNTVDKFSTVLFKAHLNGQTALVQHPARRGGRVVDSPVTKARLAVDGKTLSFSGPDTDFSIQLATVTDFEKETRALDGEDRPALSVSHVPGTTTLVTVVSLPSERVMNLLGRYFRLEYSDLVEDLADVSLSDEEVEVLVAIYSAGEGVDPLSVVSGDASQTTMVLNGLQEKELVADGDAGVVLTPKGRVVVNSRLEEVNT